jgi:hypothetical protein
MATFWTTDYNAAGVTNPKRSFRFKITIGAFGDTAIGSDIGTNVVFWAKSADKPSFSLSETTHNYLNHTFKFPGRVTWNDVTITMVDPGGERGVAFTLTKILNESGYVVPSNSNQFQTISKTKAVRGLGDVLCQQLDDEGNVLESWTLNNSFISDVNFGNLDYGNEELTEYSMTVKYDWATYNEGQGSEVNYEATT